ncbi:UvrD-helicase domain-containing protein [Nocardia sp. NPDC059180]|uniref:UvrD-helicase domain-containing protein n=1 Tax=Nocardia sp. NPDC059180 TaxID=3346761 RepID=UPI0036D02885
MSNGDPDSRRSRVYQVLREIPGLTSQHRNFLTVPLTDPSWHVFVHRDLAGQTVGESGAILVGSRGVHLLVFAEPGQVLHSTDKIVSSARSLVAGLHNDQHYFVARRMRAILLLPDGAEAAASDRGIPTRLVDFATTLSSLAQEFSPARARVIADEIASRASNYQRIRVDSPPPSPPSPTLFDRAELLAEQRAAAARGPLEEWMTFRDPEQIKLIKRKFHGPARISGPAGTGKSVVALHRMAQQLQRSGGRVLYTTFVKTLAAYQRTNFRRLAPELSGRAEFVGLHAWAHRLIEDRGEFIRIEPTQTDDVFDLAWSHCRRSLTDIEPRASHWRTEIDRVIKGRGIADLPQYWACDRRGRGGDDLDRVQRKLVWNELYLPYCDIMQRRRISDFNDLIALALESLNEKPYEVRYGMVVVDEAQDVTLTGLCLAHAIAGGGDDAPLLVVGDGQQQVYEGGCSPADAGINLRGRQAVLRVNYRNREAVYRRAATVNALNTLGDLDGSRGCALSEARFVLPGGTTVDWQGRSGGIGSALVAAIRRSPIPLAELAVITTSRHIRAIVLDALRQADIAASRLEDYRGDRTDTIKVGTVQRAKGLEFAGIFYITEPPRPPERGASSGDREQAELWDRQTMVAITRARDFAWVAFIVA